MSTLQGNNPSAVQRHIYLQVQNEIQDTGGTTQGRI